MTNDTPDPQPAMGIGRSELEWAADGFRTEASELREDTDRHLGLIGSLDLGGNDEVKHRFDAALANLTDYIGTLVGTGKSAGVYDHVAGDLLLMVANVNDVEGLIIDDLPKVDDRPISLT